MNPRNRRKTDEITDVELQDTLFIRRLLLNKVASIEDRLDNKCDSCKNTWVIRFVWLSICLMAIWIKAATAIQPTVNQTLIKAVAGEAVKTITSAVPRG